MPPGTGWEHARYLMDGGTARWMMDGTSDRSCTGWPVSPVI